MASRWTWVFLVVHFASLFLTAIGQCTYKVTPDTGGDQELWNTSPTSTVANIGECQDECTADTACISAEFLTTGGICFRFHTLTVPSFRANSIYAVKDCTGKTCSYSDQEGMKGPQNLWSGFRSAADVAACKIFCESESKCVAGEFNTGSFSCYIYSSEPTLTADTQTTFFLRTCVEDTTTTSAPTTSPTTTPTTNPKSCLMTKSSRTTVGAVDYKVSLGNADSCNSICLHTKTCRATTYTPGNCTLHSQTLTAASGDIVDFVRQTCNDGTFCCMSSATTQKTNGTPLLSISATASLEGCEAICLAVADCKGTYYSDESCFFYTTTPTTTADGPILFSKKTCPGDQTNHGQLAYDTTCEERPKKTYRQTHMYTRPQQLRIYWYYPWPYYSVPDYAYFLDTVLMLALLAD